jgi:hypothetical protein
VGALVEPEQLERSLVDAEDPAGHESRVVAEESLLALSAGADVAGPVTDDERAAVEDAMGSVRHEIAPSERAVGEPRCWMFAGVA